MGHNSLKAYEIPADGEKGVTEVFDITYSNKSNLYYILVHRNKRFDDYHFYVGQDYILTAKLENNTLVIVSDLKVSDNGDPRTYSVSIVADNKFLFIQASPNYNKTSLYKINLGDL
ncbi:MAG: hypothetical protein HOO06_09105 [Bdellovibrionaceae bacterium]|jgi:hypothetical protein|nr:hypothetical protein [Pseudobdellovibrionaceae bacterium]